MPVSCRTAYHKTGRRRFSEYYYQPHKATIEAAHRAHIENARGLCERIEREFTEKKKELADYQAEILRVIRGDSAFTQEMLTPMLKQTQAEIDRLTAELEQAQKDLQECEDGAEDELREYKQLQTWADLYKTCSFEEKKMIVSRFIKRLYVYRDYKLEIEFNVSFDEFQRLTIVTDEAPKFSPAEDVRVGA